MSSDQPSDVQFNNTFEHLHQHQYDHPFDTSYSTVCYTNINDKIVDGTISDTVNENEVSKNCRIEHSQYSKRDDISDNKDEILQNVLSIGTNEDNPSMIINESKNFESNRHATETEFNFDEPEILNSGESLKLPFEADNTLVSHRRAQDGFCVLDGKKESQNDTLVSYLNTETTHATTIIEEIHLNISDAQIQNEVDLQASTILKPRDTQQDTNDESIQQSDIQPSKSPAFEDNEMQEVRYNEEKSVTSNGSPTITEEPLNEEEFEKDDKIAETTNFNETDDVGDSDGEEIEKDIDVSTDETDLLSNDADYDDDVVEYASIDVVDFDGTSEVENNEYILDTVVQKPRKERRRIVLMNDDDSDPEMDVERERLLRSASPTVDENVNGFVDDVEEDVDIELLIQNEKPGPKSKKMSTQKLKELQARALLRNAVVIPSSGGKKRKSRIIDSDDEDEDNSLLPYSVNVDDIGLPDLSLENEEPDVIVAESIVLTDVDKTDKIPIENSILFLPPKQEEDVGGNSPCGKSSNQSQGQSLYPTEDETDNPTNITSQQSQTVNVSSESYDHFKEERREVASETTIATEKCSVANIKVEATVTQDSENSSDSTNHQQSSKEDDNENTDVHFPSFSSSSSSEDEQKFIPNDVYFGTPDVNTKRSTRGKGRPRGRPPQSSSRGIAINENGIRKPERGRGTGRRGRPPSGGRFIDNRRVSSTSDSVSTSSSVDTDDEYHKSKAKRKLQTITVVKSPSQLYHNVSLPPRPIQQQQIQRQQQHRKRDRFYDKSQDIPNSIYFGDVDVPLHVLYAYGDDSDSDVDNKVNSRLKNTNIKCDPLKANKIRFSSQVSRGQGRTISIQQQNYKTHHQLTSQYSNSRKARGRPKTNSVSPSNDRSIQMMKKFFKAAGLKKVKLNRLWEGCKSNSERAAKMLELLREKGLEGEPTMAKCKQLKLEYLTKKEIEDLDPNLIIQTEGRTRRSVTRAATKRKYAYDEDEILETRTKLRNVIDSDSDFD